jgi:hypothetical protein
MLSRRDFLKIGNDIHSQLNLTPVRDVVRPWSQAELIAALRKTRGRFRMDRKSCRARIGTSCSSWPTRTSRRRSRYATARQLDACYPQLRSFLAMKRTYDPGERFISDWYEHSKRLMQTA